MDSAELIRLYPRLYHMAEAGSWPSIARHGLLSTVELLRLYDVDDAEASEILEARRPRSVTLSRRGLSDAVVRDQGPLSLLRLEAALVDMTVPEWLRELNSHVFFWLQEKRLNTLLGARNYRGVVHDVLTVDTATLVSEYEQDIRLSRINSGATFYIPPARGSSTFLPISEYDHPPRRHALTAASDVAELLIPGAVPDISGAVIRVERRMGTDILETVYDSQER
jgi:hypothetical protein